MWSCLSLLRYGLDRSLQLRLVPVSLRLLCLLLQLRLLLKLIENLLLGLEWCLLRVLILCLLL